LVFTTQLGITIDLPSLGSIARDLGMSASGAEISVSAYVVGVAAPIPFWGFAADRWGRHATIRAAVALFVACSLLLTVVDQPWLFVALRFVQGVGGGGCAILGRILARDTWEGPELARRFAYLSVSYIVALGGGQFLGALFERHDLWRLEFVLLAAMALAALGMTSGLSLASGRPPQPLRETARVYLGLVRLPSFLAPTLAGGLSYAALLAWQQTSPLLMGELYAADAATVGNVGLLTAAAYLAGSLALGHFVLRAGQARMLEAGSLVIAGAGMAGIALWLAASTPLGAFVGFYCLVSFGQAVMFPGSMSLAIGAAPERGVYATALCSFLHQIVAGFLAACVSLLPHAEWQPTAAAFVFGLAAFALARVRP
ncbi:MAG: MFS transporter, partial [Rhodospirillales bacterium]|nr:MFS transporter [Rhodospirillales bacterium]